MRLRPGQVRPSSYELSSPRGLPRRLLSTPKVGNISGEAAVGTRARVDGRFKNGNPWRWQTGKSGNPSGRPRDPDRKHNGFALTLLDLIATVTELKKGHIRQPDEHFQKFKAVYAITGNAFQSALIAGYAPKTAKSKAYLLARRTKDAE